MSSFLSLWSYIEWFRSALDNSFDCIFVWYQNSLPSLRHSFEWIFRVETSTSLAQSLTTTNNKQLYLVKPSKVKGDTIYTINPAATVSPLTRKTILDKLVALAREPLWPELSSLMKILCTPYCLTYRIRANRMLYGKFDGATIAFRQTPANTHHSNFEPENCGVMETPLQRLFFEVFGDRNTINTMHAERARSKHRALKLWKWFPTKNSIGVNQRKFGHY